MIEIGDKVINTAIRRGGTVVDIAGDTARVSWPGYSEPIWVDRDRLRRVNTRMDRVREFLDDLLVRVETVWDDYRDRARRP